MTGQAHSLDRLTRLAHAIAAVRAGTLPSPRTLKLVSGGVPRMSQEPVEEAAEAAIEAVRGKRASFVSECADLLYKLSVLYDAMGVSLGEVWAEMDRREAILGLAEKLPKTDEQAALRQNVCTSTPASPDA